MQESWTAQPGIAPFNYGPRSSMPDLRGLRHGQLTVIGLAAKPSTKGPRWVVQCNCGNYEVRSTRALRNRFNIGDRCNVCRYGHE